MKMVSYWKDVKEIYSDNGLTLIFGWYDHKNSNHGGEKALGVHWETYPQSRQVLSPCVIPEATRNAILSGLLHDSIIKNNQNLTLAIGEALAFFRT